jgi:hypothetical protein
VGINFNFDIAKHSCLFGIGTEMEDVIEQRWFELFNQEHTDFGWFSIIELS